MYLEDSSQKLERSKKILFDILNPIKAGRFSGGDQLGGVRAGVSELWDVKTSKTHISQTNNVQSFNLSP